MTDTPKRKPGRPRKDPRGTQRELIRQARQARALSQDGEKARRERARREVQRIVRGVFAESPWFTKLIAKLFMESARRVAEASLDVDPGELGELVSLGFSDILTECATFDGLSRASRAAGPSSVPNMVAAAATPDLSAFARDTLGDFEDEDDLPSMPPLSDEEALAMGVLPEA